MPLLLLAMSVSTSPYVYALVASVFAFASAILGRLLECAPLMYITLPLAIVAPLLLYTCVINRVALSATLDLIM